MDSVAIIILNYNGAVDTIECIESVLGINNFNKSTIIIVDNKSTDNSFYLIKRWIEDYNSKLNNYSLIKNNLLKRYIEFDHQISIDKKIILIQSPCNGGFAYGNNQGIKFAKDYLDVNYVWMLNNDTTVHPESLSVLIEAYKKIPGIIGSRICYHDKKDYMQGIGANYNKYFGITKTLELNESSKKILPEFYFELDFIIGASIFTSIKIINEIDFMYEGYFLYYEEYDWTLQAKKFDVVTYCATNSIVYHKIGASIGSSYSSRKRSIYSDYWVLRNQFIFIKRNFKHLLIFCYLNTFLKMILRFLKGNFSEGFQALKILINNNAKF